MIEDRVKEYIFPKKIVKYSESVENPSNLLIEKELQIATVERDLIFVKGKGFIILDFGEEMYGGVRILSKACQTSKEEKGETPVRLRFGESLTECCVELGEKNATNNHALRDFVIHLESHSDMEFGNTGFRFLRLDFLSETTVLSIKSVVACSVYRNLEKKGSFICSDERLNEIYNTAVKTVSLCMQSMLWDGIKRDKLVWIGDMHPEMLSIRAIYGFDKCIEQGLTHAVNQFKLPEFINMKPSYSMWFVIILHDWYMQNGNIEFVKNNLDYVEDLFKLLSTQVDEQGKMHLKGYFFDWPSHDSTNSNEGGSINSIIGVKALFLISLKYAIEMFKIANKDYSFLVELINKLNSYNEGEATNKQALAFTVLSGQNNDIHKIAKILKEGNSKGFSTFMSYYILKVIAKSKDIESALNILKEYFGGMLDKGATTFWEDFDIEWLKNTCRIDEFPKKGEEDIHGDKGGYCYKGFRHSLCHGWSSGAIPFLTEFVLGVKIKEPNCNTVEIIPNLAGLSFAKGKYPTPYGIIEIEHKKVGDKVVSKIIAPKKIKIICETIS